MMATIEDGLLMSGFIPEKDYQRKDLFNAAMPLVRSINNLHYTTSWPNIAIKPVAAGNPA